MARAAAGERSCKARSAGLRWAKRLKRVFGIEIERCGRCNGEARIIASIEDPEVIGKALRHLGLAEEVAVSPGARASPPAMLF